MHTLINTASKIVVVDDDPAVLEVQVEALLAINLKPQAFTDPMEALEHLQRENVDLLITDWNMPKMTGMDLLFKTRALPHPPHVIVLTAFGTVDRAVQAMNQGAFSFLEKPFQIKRYQELVEQALKQQKTPTVVTQALQRRTEDKPATDTRPVAVSAAMQNVFETALNAAGTDSTVLLLGESGSGKEVVADYIHQHSRRKQGPLIKVNCGALPEHLMESELFGHEKGAFTGADRRNTGRFEQANSGTLFLDEIGDLLLSLQVKLLRALQERTIERVGSSVAIPVNFRLICATHRDLHAAIAQKIFREDLFYRINVIPIRIPALRQRPEDIEPLAQHFFQTLRSRLKDGPASISADAIETLKRYHWPGNVRQLRNAIEYSLVLCRSETISSRHLPEDVRASPPISAEVFTSGVRPAPQSPPTGGSEGLKKSVQNAEEEAIRAALERHRWRMTAVAKELRISRSTLYQRMEKYGLKRDMRG